MLFYPMFAMFMLIFAIGIVTARARFGHVKSKEVSPKYFLLMQGDNIPEAVLKTGRCFSNQFEFPLLFFVVCLAYMVLGLDTLTGCIAAWTFVAFRAIHAFVFLTSNNLIKRMLSFWAGVFAVVVMWIDLFILVSAGSGLNH
ncbi:MAPEG family protein [Psychrosphaera aestuarii]|uniref:MAPEG family protein n=1 Tax=Psychrosphaera aestuarii TaxID=1266052 RepID=UPI001B332C05|nr:MAPEG family protein [Psychrosphaera aestuarii]